MAWYDQYLEKDWGATPGWGGIGGEYTSPVTTGGGSADGGGGDDEASYMPGWAMWEAELAAEMARAREATAAQRYQAELSAQVQRERMRMEQEYNQWALGQQYLQMLSGLRGPRDWMQYWNVARSAQGTPLPRWATALQQGLSLPAYQAPGAIPENLGFWGPNVSAAPQGGGGGGQGWAQSLGTFLPHQINPQQWGNMLPSEREGLLGYVENQGMYAPDYLQQMQAAWPSRGISTRTVWG